MQQNLKTGKKLKILNCYNYVNVKNIIQTNVYLIYPVIFKWGSITPFNPYNIMNITFIIVMKAIKTK